MTTALIIAIAGGIIYLATALTERYQEIGELGRLAFLAGLIAFLLK
jgi:hypothetical protein